MNELQKTALDILKEFIRVCDLLDVTYYLVCGSALGAVKYGGFIPWDDDIDVGMPRKDYETFLAQAQAHLPAHLFLQNYRTDSAFPFVFSKLRNSNTTLISQGAAHLPINHGIFIDIFPLDGYPQSQREIKRLYWQKKALCWMQFCALKGGVPMKVRIRNQVFRMLGYHRRTRQTLARLDRLISQWSTESSEIWCNHGNWQGEKEYAPKWQYGGGVKMQFEGLEVVVPARYDAYLTQKYGDWRSDPPIEQQKSHHLIEVLDVNRPYTAYLEAHAFDKQ